MDKLAIVIPFYNEADCIPSLIKELDEFIDLIDAAITVFAINDGSKDETKELLTHHAQSRKWLNVINQPNGGHGNAVLNGYHKALEDKTEWIFQVDSDQQIPINELIPLWNNKSHDESVLGVRRNRQDPQERLAVSKILKFLIQFLFAVKVEDANCPFRLVNSSQLRFCLQFIPKTTFAPNIFISIILIKIFKVKQAHVSHVERQGGTNSINRINLFIICKRCLLELYQFWQTRNSWKKSLHISPSSL